MVDILADILSTTDVGPDEATHHVLHTPRHEVDSCQIQSWWPSFRKHSIKTVLVPLPPAFVEYLHEVSLSLLLCRLQSRLGHRFDAICCLSSEICC